MSDVRRLLNDIEAGDPHAASRLLPLVYDELRRLASALMADEKRGQTLDATALVHEAYLRMVKGNAQTATDTSATHENHRRYANPRHFFAAAAEAMRRILIENARRKQSQKRGGDRTRVDADQIEIAAPSENDELLAVDEAVDDLATVNPLAAEVVKLRYFVGLSIADAADVLGISPRTTDRAWSYARAWLHSALNSDSP